MLLLVIIMSHFESMNEDVFIKNFATLYPNTKTPWNFTPKKKSRQTQDQTTLKLFQYNNQQYNLYLPTKRHLINWFNVHCQVFPWIFVWLHFITLLRITYILYYIYYESIQQQQQHTDKNNSHPKIFIANSVRSLLF